MMFTISHGKSYSQNGSSDDDKISCSIHLREGSFAVLKSQKLTETADELESLQDEIKAAIAEKGRQGRYDAD